MSKNKKGLFGKIADAFKKPSEEQIPVEVQAPSFEEIPAKEIAAKKDKKARQSFGEILQENEEKRKVKLKARKDAKDRQAES